MAQTSENTTGPGNKVPHAGDHDRVQMLSLRADGVPDQHNPELIGDPEVTLAATKVQFAEQAVSAVDVAERGVSTVGGEEVSQDPGIEKLTEQHVKAAQSAGTAAESAVKALKS